MRVHEFPGPGSLTESMSITFIPASDFRQLKRFCLTSDPYIADSFFYDRNQRRRYAQGPDAAT